MPKQRNQQKKTTNGQSVGRPKRRRTNVRRLNQSLVYRDRITGRFVSKSTWKRSRAGGGSRYRGERRYSANLNILGFGGYVPVVVHSFKKAQFASKHLIAVARFLRSGDTELLKPFVGQRLGGVALLSDPDRLGVLGDAGSVKLDALYRNNSGGRRKK